MHKYKRKRKVSASAGVGAFDTHQIAYNHEIDATYTTDELDSDVDCEGEGMHQYLMFKAEDIERDFKFRFGMEFSSLKEFKKALKGVFNTKWKMDYVC